MKTFLKLTLSGLTLGFGFNFSAAGQASTTCDLLKCASELCYTTIQKKSLFPTAQNCDAMYIELEVPWIEPPQPAGIECATSATGLYCEAWPQGDELTYQWQGSAALAVPNNQNPANPVVPLNCASSPTTLSVTVIGPSGASSLQTVALPACSP